jgi:hypothetical protein
MGPVCSMPLAPSSGDNARPRVARVVRRSFDSSAAWMPVAQKGAATAAMSATSQSGAWKKSNKRPLPMPQLGRARLGDRDRVVMAVASDAAMALSTSAERTCPDPTDLLATVL